ncbi:unnamed protein product [Bursaphelenchus xylophilus]|uniref:(pine wood nematode) hypothetical protein n=1 Tax=Bursaphelenchus xylophilus TaxID=6326 RepID=A0A811LIE3_BURXY|nr:unnamed protein product [Bursaphelenchus xylophilus]CAG9117332.1 unnamed protein product [Bursaphelenchus xylophilus]
MDVRSNSSSDIEEMDEERLAPLINIARRRYSEVLKAHSGIMQASQKRRSISYASRPPTQGPNAVNSLIHRFNSFDAGARGRRRRSTIFDRPLSICYETPSEAGVITQQLHHNLRPPNG